MEKGEKVAALAVAIHVVLFGIKYIFSTLSGSIALKADAFHSLSDVVASSTVFIGLIIAKRKTKSFPYGLYKVENLVSVMVAIAIFYAVPLTDAHQHRISPHFGEAPKK
ncbi:MAG: cation transporter [Deltaproteobacteria bacterium]|nr:cation transporter [Deltaproteobacteria bacterium]